MSASTLKRLSHVVLIFGALCYLTSCAMDFGGSVQLQESVAAGGGTVGPFTIEEAGTVLDVNVRQRINGGFGYHKYWSFVTAELLDENQQYLTGFGGEFWDESGRGWQEDDEQYRTKITIPEAGQYYLRFQTESDANTSALSPIQVSIDSKQGSSLPHHVAAWLAFIGGGGLWLLSVFRRASDGGAGTTASHVSPTARRPSA